MIVSFSEILLNLCLRSTVLRHDHPSRYVLAYFIDNVPLKSIWQIFFDLYRFYPPCPTFGTRSVFNLFSRIIFFIRENKLKMTLNFTISTFGTRSVFSLFSRIIFFYSGKQIKINSKFCPLDFWNLVRFKFVFPNKFFYSGKQIKNGPSSKSRRRTILSHF